MANSFIYQGLEFKPLRKFTGQERGFENISTRIRDRKLTPQGWNYHEFYKTAKENGVGNYDLFIMNGKTVVPATRILFEYEN